MNRCFEVWKFIFTDIEQKCFQSTQNNPFSIRSHTTRGRQPRSGHQFGKSTKKFHPSLCSVTVCQFAEKVNARWDTVNTSNGKYIYFTLGHSKFILWVRDSPLRFYCDWNFSFKKKITSPLHFFGSINFLFIIIIISLLHFCSETLIPPPKPNNNVSVTFLSLKKKFASLAPFWGEIKIFFRKKKNLLACSFSFCWESVIHKINLVWPYINWKDYIFSSRRHRRWAKGAMVSTSVFFWPLFLPITLWENKLG